MPNASSPNLPRSGSDEETFAEVVRLITASRTRAIQAVNVTLINLYWQVAEIISRKIEAAEWGDGVVDALARHIARAHPGLRGFTRANLFRMRQFYETYRNQEEVAPLVRQLPWSHNLVIFGQAKRPEDESSMFGWRSPRPGAVASWSGK